jgi:hypothetical protein
MKEVFKFRDAHVTPQNIQEVQASKLGLPRGTPSSSAKIRSPFKTLYFYCFMYYVYFLENLYFSFQFSFVLFAEINVSWFHQQICHRGRCMAVCRRG